MKKAQIWVETVIYTLIGLAIIGLLLSIVTPAIKKRQDKILIETSMEMLSSIESIIEEVKYRGAGNSRPIEFRIRKGKLEFDSINDKINFSIETNYKYSEPEEVIKKGKLNILTDKKTEKVYDVFLSLDYSSSLNLSWNEKEDIRSFQNSPSLNIVFATNKGKRGNMINIDFS